VVHHRLERESNLADDLRPELEGVERVLPLGQRQLGPRVPDGVTVRHPTPGLLERDMSIRTGELLSDVNLVLTGTAPLARCGLPRSLEGVRVAPIRAHMASDLELLASADSTMPVTVKSLKVVASSDDELQVCGPNLQTG
jgi:hypothetical protein